MNQTKSCLHCQAQFEITSEDLDFYTKISPTFVGEKFTIPTPTLCPDCRQRRRLSFRNERNLYRRTCDASGKQIISIYAPKEVPLGDKLDSEYRVYDQKIWRSDQWNPMDYGRDFDFTKSFTEQFGALSKVVPLCSIYNINSENSEYTNICAFNKNCYMLIESSNNEDCYYGYRLQRSQQCVDCSMINSSLLCYESIDLDNCYNLHYSSYCKDCKFSYAIENCINCEYCIGCFGLENQKYMFLNKQISKEDFEQMRQKYQTDDQYKKSIMKQWQEHRKTFPCYKHIRNSQSVSGNYITNSEGVYLSYEIHDARDVRYSKHVWFESGDCMDVDTVGYRSFLMYECINTALDAYDNIFCIRCRSGCRNLIYCFNCDGSQDCFGCIGLRNKQYCIFNKQYTKEEYEIMVGKIIRHMINTGERGEFFHPSLSPFGYNETVAQEYFPLSQDVIARNGAERNDEAIHNYVNQIATSEESGFLTSSQGRQRFGYHWSTYESPKPVSDKVIKGSELGKYDPVGTHGNASDNTIHPQSDDILQYAIACEVSGKLFRIQAAELAFYRKHHIPLPRKHPDVRHMERMKLRK